MKNSYIKVYMTTSTKEAIKNRAAKSGKPDSKIALEWIESVLNNSSESEDESRAGSSRTIEMDEIRKAVSEAVMEGIKGGGAGIPPETLRFLVQDVAKIENLLRQLSLFFSPGKFDEHAERVRIAEQKSERILKKLKLDEVEDVDRIERKVLTKEETDQMLKEMGIEAGGEK